MTRRAARVSHDEVRRMVKAVQSCGLAIGKVVFDGASVSVVISGDSGDMSAPSVDGDADPENVESLEQYKAWRDRSRAGGP